MTVAEMGGQVENAIDEAMTALTFGTRKAKTIVANVSALTR